MARKKASKRKGKKREKRRSARKKAAERAVETVAQAVPEAPPGEAQPAVALAVAVGPEPPPADVPPDSEPPVEDLDADLDDAGAYGSYEALVAEVAGISTENPHLDAVAERPAEDLDAEPVEDLDAILDLDEDAETSEVLERLIAETAAGAPRDVAAVEPEPEPEVALIDLDADEPPTPVAKAPVTRGVRPAISETERLARAAAAGAPDEGDGPAEVIDLGAISTPEARARLLAEALAHAEHKEASYRVPLGDQRRAGRWKGLAASVLFVLAGAVAVAPPAWVRPEPPAQLNVAARARSIRMALLLQAQQVEAFRVRSQRLPTSLAELSAALPGLRYTRSGNRAYQLVAYELDGNAIIYDSANPAPPFRILMSVLTPGEAAP